MNRLQKKCVIATAGFHLLLLLILVFGSAFFSPRPKPDDTQLLDVIPANLIDAAFNSGVRNATPPSGSAAADPAAPASASADTARAKSGRDAAADISRTAGKYFKPEPAKADAGNANRNPDAQNTGQPHTRRRTAPKNSAAAPPIRSKTRGPSTTRFARFETEFVPRHDD